MKTHYSDPFQALSDQSRRQILYLLAKDDLSINSLALNFKMSRPAVSKHIKILHSAGFVHIKDIGRERVCTLKKEGFKEVKNWFNFFDTFWSEKLNALNAFLSKPGPAIKTKKTLIKKK